MNRRLAPGVDTVFFMTDERNHYVSLVAGQGGRQPRRRRQRLVPAPVVAALAAKYDKRSPMTFPIKLASRLDPIKPSITLAVTAKAAKLKADGIDVVSFGAGEPDFDTPAHIKDAARAALDKAASASTPTSPASCRAARRSPPSSRACTRHRRSSPSRCSSRRARKHSLYNLFMALLDPGDEVLIPAPYWVSYPDMVMLAGGRPVILETRAEDDFAVTAEQVAAACSPRTRAIVLNNPSNPTGAVYTRAQIEALAQVVVEHDLLVISDDIYRQLVYGDAEYVSIAAVSPEVATRTILVDGVSKTYAMTGWRIGYTAGAAAADQGDDEDPGPVDLEPDAHRADRGARGAHRPAGLRRRDARRSTSAATRSCWLSARISRA